MKSHKLFAFFLEMKKTSISPSDWIKSIDTSYTAVREISHANAAERIGYTCAPHLRHWSECNEVMIRVGIWWDCAQAHLGEESNTIHEHEQSMPPNTQNYTIYMIFSKIPFYSSKRKIFLMSVEMVLNTNWKKPPKLINHPNYWFIQRWFPRDKIRGPMTCASWHTCATIWRWMTAGEIL